MSMWDRESWFSRLVGGGACGGAAVVATIAILAVSVSKMSYP